MRKMLGGNRPDITPAQIIAGIPVIATLLHVFGVYSLSPEQEDALSATVQYAFVLLGADAVIRVGRAHADAKVNAAALSGSLGSGGPDGAHAVAPPLTPQEITEELGGDLTGVYSNPNPSGILPTDAEEDAFPPGD